ncbi:MAG: TolB family protein [Geodermatophilaceae bacterium]
MVDPADGSGVANLTNQFGVDVNPAWSPDGSRIVFISDRDRAGQLPPTDVYVMQADGTGVVRATDNPDSEEDVEWRPTERR